MNNLIFKLNYHIESTHIVNHICASYPDKTHPYFDMIVAIMIKELQSKDFHGFTKIIDKSTDENLIISIPFRYRLFNKKYNQCLNSAKIKNIEKHFEIVTFIHKTDILVSKFIKLLHHIYITVFELYKNSKLNSFNTLNITCTSNLSTF